jgi:hypothetical protein
VDVVIALLLDGLLICGRKMKCKEDVMARHKMGESTSTRCKSVASDEHKQEEEQQQHSGRGFEADFAVGCMGYTDVHSEQLALHLIETALKR